MPSIFIIRKREGYGDESGATMPNFGSRDITAERITFSIINMNIKNRLLLMVVVWEGKK
jgi:hypothetical protein